MYGGHDAARCGDETGEPGPARRDIHKARPGCAAGGFIMMQTAARPDRPVTEAFVELEDVSKNFGPKQALRHVSFTVPAGQICGMLGPNGAGKTTLFRLLMGVLKATSGRVSVAGLNAFDDRVEVVRQLGF